MKYRGENYQVFFSGYPAKINFMDLSASGIEGRWDVEIIRGRREEPGNRFVRAVRKKGLWYISDQNWRLPVS